jgi:hypothetical protein
METKPINNETVISLIRHIAQHYENNISTQFIRPMLLQLSLEKPVWDLIEAMTTRPDRYRTYWLDDLYRQIGAMAKLVAGARRDLSPTLRNRIGAAGAAGQEKTLRDMAAAAFPTNINVLADYVNTLFDTLVKIDEADTKDGRQPLHPQMMELIDVKRNLGFRS